MCPSSSARAKLDRASEHIDTVKQLVEGWLGTDAYTVSREIDPETGDTVRRAKIIQTPPERISVVAGDAIQNLRSTLDHVVYALADRHSTLTPAIEQALMFPIIGNVNSKGEAANGADIFKSSVGRWLAGVPECAVGFIETVQPYYQPGHGGSQTDYLWNPLWRLHDLNRIDKHRRLTVTTAWLGLQTVHEPAGVNSNTRFKRAEGPVKDDDVLVTYSGAQQGVNAQFSRGVALNEGPGPGQSIITELEGLQSHVAWVASALERFL